MDRYKNNNEFIYLGIIIPFFIALVLYNLGIISRVI